MITSSSVSAIRQKYGVLARELDERARRLWAASEAMALGRGGITAVAEATDMAISTIRAGIGEVRTAQEGKQQVDARRVRGSYPKGIKVKNKELAQVQIARDEFHGDWNYAILPREKPKEL